MTTKQDGQIIVQDLRPMSEAKRNEAKYLVAGNWGNDLFEVTYSKYDNAWITENDDYFFMDDLKGHIPMPIYKPKAPSCQDAVNMGLKA